MIDRNRSDPKAGGDVPRDTGDAMQSMGDIGGNAIHTTRGVLHEAIAATGEVGSDLIGGVSHLAADVVHGVHDVALEVRDGATGIVGAVGTVGGSAVHALTGLLVDVVGGVRQVVGAAVGRDARNAYAPFTNNDTTRHGSEERSTAQARGSESEAAPATPRAGSSGQGASGGTAAAP
jgi:hypothetical protein